MIFNIIQSILSGLMVFAFCFAAVNAPAVSASLFVVLLLSIFATGIFSLAQYKAKTGLSILFFISLITAYFIIFIIEFDFTRILERGFELIKWSISFISATTSFNPKFGFFLVIIIIIAFSFFVVQITRFRIGTIICIIVTTGYFGYLWFNYVDSAKFLMLIFIFSGVMKISLKNIKDKLHIKSMAFILIICFTSTFFAMESKIAFKPLYFEWLNDKIIEVFPFVLDWRNEGNRGTNFGDPIKLSEKEIMQVETDYKNSLYLKNNSFGSFINNEWKKDTNSAKAFAPSIVKVSGSFKDSIALEKVKIKVRHSGITTDNAYVPMVPQRISLRGTKTMTINESVFFFSRRISRKENYEIESEIPYITKSMSNDIIQKIRSMKEINIPETMPYRVRELTGRIISVAELNKENIQIYSSVALEPGLTYYKAQAVAEYLRSHYKYTLEPPIRNKADDFVEFFLFNSKQGYCAHFATAMTMMLRSVGIEARYVEGFISPGTYVNKRIVKANQSHAWVEVYSTDTNMWITFEPTPIMVSTTFENSNNTDQIDGVPGEVNIPTNNSEDDTISANSKPKINKTDNEIESNNIKTDKTIIGRIVSFLINAFLVLFALIFIVILFRVLFSMIFVVIKKASLKRYLKNGSELFKTRYLSILNYYSAFLGVKPETGSTLGEHFSKLIAMINESEKVKEKYVIISNLKTYSEISERLFYSKDGISVEEKNILIRGLNIIERAGFQRLGFFESMKRRILI